MGVAFVQGVVGSFDKHFGPLNERGGAEASEGTDDDLLEERGLHWCFNSSEGARTVRELRIFAGMPNSTQPSPSPTDAEQLKRLLDLELTQKRVAWKQAKQRNKSLRSLAFLFLFLLIAGILFGFFFVYTRVSEQRPIPPAQTTGH